MGTEFDQFTSWNSAALTFHLHRFKPSVRCAEVRTAVRPPAVQVLRSAAGAKTFPSAPSCSSVCHSHTAIRASAPPVPAQRSRIVRRLRVNSPLPVWHRIVQTHDASALNQLLAEDVVFYSPVVHAPQQGKKLTAWYLSAALDVFVNETFRYVREVVGQADAALEFETVIDGVIVNGVDLIKWDKEGRITEFKVMIRPMQAINAAHLRMAATLQPLRPKA